MAHLPDFISDLTIILIIAAIISIIFKKLKQPVVLGYIVAGFLASFHFKRFAESLVIKATGEQGMLYDILEALPEISDMGNVSIWADIGVIFLLFALGLDFSFKKLIEVGSTASIATFITISAMIILGYTVGQALGWSAINSLFLGTMLSMSSTTIIIKSFTDMSLQNKKFASIVFAMLIVEDLAAVLILVLLSAISVSNHFEGTELLFNILKLGFFIFIWFLVGIYLIPTILKKLKAHLNDETLIILSVGLCLGMVYFATAVGFSSALGAFVMGSILAETVESKHIEKLLEPLKYIFGAIFFVSVGMMIDPSIVYDYAPIILLLTTLVIVGRFFFGTLGVLASGQSLKVSVQAGSSIALIGEFSFIIASLGMSLNVIDEQLYPIIVSVSVISIFVSPYMMKSSDKLYDFALKLVPKKWNLLIEGYASSGNNRINKQKRWREYLNKTIKTVATYFTISVAILLISYHLFTPFVSKYIPNIWGRLLNSTVTFLIMAPFLKSLLEKDSHFSELVQQWKDERMNIGVAILVLFIRLIIVVALIISITISLFEIPFLAHLIIALVLTFLIFISKQFGKQSRYIENRFLTNLNRKDNLARNAETVISSAREGLISKDIHVENIVIPQTSLSSGKTLQELNFRQTTGVHIIAITRGHITINIPKANERLFPLDTITVVGSDEEIQHLLELVNAHKQDLSLTVYTKSKKRINIAQYLIHVDSLFANKSLIELDIQNNAECIVVGIDREGVSISDFTPDLTLREGDVLWLAGEENSLNSFEGNILSKFSR